MRYKVARALILSAAAAVLAFLLTTGCETVTPVRPPPAAGFDHSGILVPHRTNTPTVVLQ